jgi:hypothetical protein
MLPTVGQGDHSRSRRPRRCYRIIRQSRCAATRVWVPTARIPPLTLSHTAPQPLPTRHHAAQPRSSPSHTIHVPYTTLTIRDRRHARNIVLKRRRTMTGPSEVRTRPAARLIAPPSMQSHPGASPIKPVRQWESAWRPSVAGSNYPPAGRSRHLARHDGVWARPILTTPDHAWPRSGRSEGISTLTVRDRQAAGQQAARQQAELSEAARRGTPGHAYEGALSASLARKTMWAALCSRHGAPRETLMGADPSWSAWPAHLARASGHHRAPDRTAHHTRHHTTTYTASAFVVRHLTPTTGCIIHSQLYHSLQGRR